MANISENLEALKTAKDDIRSAYVEKGIDMTGITLPQYGQVLRDFEIKGEPNLMLYLVNYIEQEDGTYEMQITDYVEGGVGEKMFIGTTDNGDGTMDIVMYEAE